MPVEIAFLVGFVSSVISILGNKLANSSLRETESYLDVEKNLAKLTSGIDCVQSALEKVDDVHLADSSFKWWAGHMAMLCYDAYDIVDDINLEIMRLDRANHVGCEVLCESNTMSSCLPRGNCDEVHSLSHSSDKKTQVKTITSSLMKKWKLSDRIYILVRRLDDMRTQVNQAVEQSSTAHITRQPRPFRGAAGPSSPTMKREKQNIIEKLLEMNYGGITIAGVAGLGKSVLAYSILCDDQITQSCNAINWASASNWNSVDDIKIRPIKTCDTNSTSRSKILLLLLDDLRITGLRDWKHLKDELVSRLQHTPTHIIITCRDPAVARYTDTTLYPLKTLSDKDCQEIINTVVLSENRVTNYHGILLEHEVKRIAGKCGGLSLVADVIGSYLSSEYKSNPESFEEVISAVEHRDLWEQHVFLHEILPELGFDAKSLPKKLYKFLAYFALFPCGYMFHKNEVSMLWMAEGFTPAGTEWTLRPAVDHFGSLVSTSMLQPLCSSSPQVYQMKNFAHRYVQRIARCVYFWLNEESLSSMENGNVPSDYKSSSIRHFSVCCRKLEQTILEDIVKYHEKLRTFLLFKVDKCEIKIGHVPNSLFKKLKYLRVISLSGTDIRKLPTTISNMRRLRYLDVSYTCILGLPTEISNLLGLQVLKLNDCRQLVSLPMNFETLINLTCLELNMSRLASLPTHMGKLTNLQTLPLFIVRSLEGQGVSELKNMNSLGGSLTIRELENITNKNEAKEAMLHKKPKIKTLSLEWLKDEPDPTKAKGILTGLRPSDKLKELKVSNYRGITFPNWVIRLKDVRHISLHNCPNCKELPDFGLLPLLKKLELQEMDNIKKVARCREAAHQREYPALEYLKIRRMEKLRTWHKLQPGDMPHLLELHVSECPQLISLPKTSHLLLLQSVDFTSCPRLMYSL